MAFLVGCVIGAWLWSKLIAWMLVAGLEASRPSAIKWSVGITAFLAYFIGSITTSDAYGLVLAVIYTPILLVMLPFRLSMEKNKLTSQPSHPCKENTPL